ncbi:aromatase/cyclase [Amycolatopsis panacis]|uniref:Cyclase n=1 Tax=Amycolatopsis panacis TaxID=2340917 RepID=A0A419I6B3_9PSEU|nr:aromatase/cyclase [Amycolatopsis panacis]RJQ86839.1 cyclase [Amycolatopsis panacis]
MPAAAQHHTEHRIDIDAPAGLVYRIIADATEWPRHFTPTVHVDQSELDGQTERLHIWANANGQLKNWTSLRELDERAGRIRFRQEVSAPPVASMGGEWIVSERSAERATLVLTHDFAAVDDDPAGVEWITKATNGNSDTELANIKALAERWERMDRLAFDFEDSVLVRAPRERAYHFLDRVDLWPDRLPHVARLQLREDVPGVQHMSMDTKAKDGSTHTTESVRVCFPEARIVYKQLVPPALLTTHTGVWTFEDTVDGVLVTSAHTVVLNEANIGTVPGPAATVESTRDFVRNAISGNSQATLRHAKAFAEATDA